MGDAIGLARRVRSELDVGVVQEVFDAAHHAEAVRRHDRTVLRVMRPLRVEPALTTTDLGQARIAGPDAGVESSEGDTGARLVDPAHVDAAIEPED